MSEITRALAVTAELTGTELSAISLKAMEAELSQYPVRAVLDALNRCRRELTGRMTLAAVLERINAIDGRPTANEAWAAQRASDLLTVPLCAEHHRGGSGLHGMGVKAFERTYRLSELDLLAMTLEALEP